MGTEIKNVGCFDPWRCGHYAFSKRWDTLSRRRGVMLRRTESTASRCVSHKIRKIEQVCTEVSLLLIPDDSVVIGLPCLCSFDKLNHWQTSQADMSHAVSGPPGFREPS